MILKESQYDFRRGRGAREIILGLKIILEKQLRRDQNTFIAFIDLEMKFDNIIWKELFRMLKEVGVKHRDK